MDSEPDGPPMVCWSRTLPLPRDGSATARAADLDARIATLQDRLMEKERDLRDKNVRLARLRAVMDLGILAPLWDGMALDERALLVLFDLGCYPGTQVGAEWDEGFSSVAFTRDDLASRVGAATAAVGLALKRMSAAGLLEGRMVRLTRGGVRKQRAFCLTVRGVQEVHRLVDLLRKGELPYRIVGRNVPRSRFKVERQAWEEVSRLHRAWSRREQAKRRRRRERDRLREEEKKK